MQILGLGARPNSRPSSAWRNANTGVAHNIPARLTMQAGDVEIEVHRLEKDDIWVGGSVRITARGRERGRRDFENRASRVPRYQFPHAKTMDGWSFAAN